MKCILFLLLLLYVFPAQEVTAQQTVPVATDTFFLAKKKGLLGRLGRSVATNPPDEFPQKVENQFLQFKGKIIRSVEVERLSFQRNINDTNEVKYNLGVRLANTFHKNSTENVIRNNLFFKEGQEVYPYLLADNERYLRDLIFIQDARIIVAFAENSTDSVDVLVLTKDIFSMGAKVKIDSKKRGRIEGLGDENVAGSGTRLAFGGFYDEPRKPQKAFMGEITRRNIGGSFIDWTAGVSNYASSFTTGRREEQRVFTSFEKPLVTPFIPGTGAIEAGFYKSANAYVSDSLYNAAFRYGYYNLDGWFGYSLDRRRGLYANRQIRIHNFIALRAFDQHFTQVPVMYKTVFDHSFSNTTGALASLNIFKQVFYKTNFIYGFGRNEDVPEGFSLALTGGYIIKQNPGYVTQSQVRRPYSGLDFTYTNFKKRGFYSNFTVRGGGYFYRRRFEDINMLFNVEHFTRLRKINQHWYQRTFINTGIAAQANPVFTEPLVINSVFGLPYFNPENIKSDLRTTIKLESVYYNTKKILGFRIAPFVFTDGILLKQAKQSLKKSDFYSAIGGGIRTRNENLVFGTIELRGYYFPRENGNMRGWKVEFSTNIRFKYNSSFIKKPGVVSAN